MPAEHVHLKELDISERLRALMLQEKLTVADLASAAGVSKSAMEKYLAGPSSPRATAIASLCANLGVSAEWLLFGPPHSDRRRIRNLAFSALFQLMQELRTPGPLKEEFQRLESGSPAFTSFAVNIATERAEALSETLWDMRKSEMRAMAGGMTYVLGPDLPIHPGDDEDGPAT